MVSSQLTLAQAYAINDGGVVELIGDDCVLWTQHGLKDTAVGVEARAVQDAVIHIVELGQRRFKLLVDVLPHTHTEREREREREAYTDTQTHR